MTTNYIHKFSYHAKGHLLTFKREWVRISGDKLQYSQNSLDEVDTNRISHHFQICLTRLANNKISTFKVKVLSSIFVQNWLEVGVILSIPKWRSMMKTCFPIKQKGIFWPSRESSLGIFSGVKPPHPQVWRHSPTYESIRDYLYFITRGTSVQRKGWLHIELQIYSVFKRTSKIEFQAGCSQFFPNFGAELFLIRS